MTPGVLIFKILGYALVALIVYLVRGRKKAPWMRRILAACIMWTVFTFALVFAVNGGPIAITICVTVLLLAFGGPMATHFATPAGLPKAAHALATFGAVAFHIDSDGIGNIAAARAHLVIRNRRQQPPIDELTALADRIAKTRVLRPGSIAAHAFSCLALGDREQARILFKSIGDFAVPLRTGPAQSFAARWLVADAASAGDWAALRNLPRRLDTRLTRFAAACATRIEQGPEAVKSSRLRARWLASPSRIATRPLLKMALTAPAPRVSSVAGHLMARHVAALKGHASIEAMVLLANEWENVVYDLDADARASVLESLAAMADATPALRRRHQFFTGDSDPMRDFELAVGALQRRIEDERILPPLDEWVELARIRDLYEQLTLDEAYRPVAYGAISHLITNYAADMFNTRGQKPIANALFVWMEREARIARDAEMLKLNRDNVACGYG